MSGHLPVVTPATALPGRAIAVEPSQRHVVLGNSLTGPWPDGSERIYVGMGCFWGAERLFWEREGVYVTAVGYMGGWTPHPTYEETCTGLTGHAEVVQVVFDPDVVSVESLLATFWDNHDPTTSNRQGNDIGTQYRSAIFTTSPAQHDVAVATQQRYQGQLDAGGYDPITTDIVPADEAGDGTFYYAEDYHQGYLHKNPRGYCNHGLCQVEYAASV